MSKQSKSNSPELSLSIQYGLDEARLPRWRLRRWIEMALEAAYADRKIAFKRVQLGFRLVDEAEGRELNAGFRQKDYATNVLTFEYGVATDGTASGDIVLCVPVLIREAREQSKTFLDHAAHLTVHGTLHSLGYDHLRTREARHMEALETEVLARMKISNPYE